MRSKKSTYLLLVAVMAVWGAIVWKMFFRSEDEIVPVAPAQRTAVDTATADTLVLDYRDPFLGEAATPKPPARVTSARSATAPPVEEPPPYIEHRLRYLGQITRGGTAYGLVEIDGTLHTIRRGDAVGSYRLESIWRDSVRLRHAREMITVRR